MVMQKTVVVECKCPVCRKSTPVTVEAEAYRKWMSGQGYVQTTFPYLSDDEREALITGTCRECYDGMCPGPDSED